MRIGSLFAGIGGLEKGLEDAGVGHTVWQVERDPFCRDVLAKHWPHAARHDDVRTVGAHNLEPVDVICGGFPCQDISYAGKGAGLAGERSGLWYEFARIVGEMGPHYVVVENVAALLTRGIDAVLGTLADLGYDAEWSTLRASDVGAPHRRERVFLVAYTTESRRRWGKDAGAGTGDARANGRGRVQSERSGRDMGHAESERRAGRENDAHGGRRERTSGHSDANVEHPSRGGRRAGAGVDVRRAERGRDCLDDPHCDGAERKGGTESSPHSGCDGVGDANDPGAARQRLHGGAGLPESGERGSTSGRVGDADRAASGRDAGRIRREEAQGDRTGSADGRRSDRLGDASGDVEHAASGGRGTGAGVDVRQRDEVEHAAGQRPETRERAAHCIGGRRGERCAASASGGGGVVHWSDATPVRGADGTVRLIPAEAAAQGPESPLWPVADGVPGRVARLRAIGNAVVPACAEVVGRRLLEIDAELRREVAA